MDSAEAKVINVRLDSLVDSVARMANAFEEMQKQMHVLTALKVQQDHITQQLTAGATTMGKHEERISTIEKDMPGLKELRRWVVGGVLAGLGMMGTALGKLVIYDMPRTPPAVAAVPQTTATGK